MKMMKSDTDKDVANVEAWAEVIEDLLYSVPPAKRAEVLELAARKEAAKVKAREIDGGIEFIKFTDDWVNGPGQRHYNAIQRLKSLLVQIFVRDISNNNSEDDAAGILYVQHRHGTGSGLLQDYLPAQELAE